MSSQLAALAAAMLLGASTVKGQTKPYTIEVGADVGLSYVSEKFGPETFHSTTLSLPVQAIRVGFFAGDKFEIEPRVGLNLSHSGGDTFTEYSVQLGLLYHLNANALGDRVYLRPFVGLTGEAGSGAPGEHQTIFGGGVGVKIPFATRFATRLEALYSHETAPSNLPSNDAPSTNTFGLLIGLSVFN